MQLSAAPSRMAVAGAPVSRARAVQCKALFGSTATKAGSGFFNFKVKVGDPQCTVLVASGQQAFGEGLITLTTQYMHICCVNVLHRTLMARTPP
jgi:hypothetical protein